LSYSALSATIGPTRVARRARTRLATAQGRGAGEDERVEGADAVEEARQQPGHRRGKAKPARRRKDITEPRRHRRTGARRVSAYLRAVPSVVKGETVASIGIGKQE